MFGDVRDSVLFRKALLQNNYKVVYNSLGNKKECIIFFSSNDIYYPNTQDQLESVIENNRFEWENIAKSKGIVTKYGKMIFVRDLWKQWYVRGISFKIDSVDKIVEFLRTEIENMNVTIVGNSSGGYMATLAAQKLNAKIAYCISGQFDILDQAARQPIVGKAVEEKYEYTNIVTAITSATVIYLYPALCEWDKQQANLVRDKKLVVSIPFSNSRHGETCYGFNFPYILTQDESFFVDLMQNAPMGGGIPKTNFCLKVLDISAVHSC